MKLTQDKTKQNSNKLREIHNNKQNTSKIKQTENKTTQNKIRQKKESTE